MAPTAQAQSQIAFQTNTGGLWVSSPLPNTATDVHAGMASGTNPSINDYGVVAFQGNNRDLWAWNSGPFGGGTDLDVEMMAGTSPSSEPGIAALGVPPPPTASVVRGGSDNDRLDSGSGGDLIRGGPSNDQIYGGQGNDVSYDGPGKDRVYGGRGNDLLYGGGGNDVLYGGPGKNRIVDHRGATTVFAGSGASLVDVADGRGDDRVVCAPGSFTDVFADRGARTGSCGSEGLPITAGGAAAH
jgi:Ca2+-binding RTX toxin-like protein